MNGNGKDNQFDDIRRILAETAEIQRQQSVVLKDHAHLLAEHDERMVRHDERMADHDERMERVGRHLEVLISVVDDLIREKQDRRRKK